MLAKPRHLVDRLGFVAPLCFAAANAQEAVQCAARFSSLWSERSLSIASEGEHVLLRMPLSSAPSQVELDHALDMLELMLELIERVRGIYTHPGAVYLPALPGEMRDRFRTRFACVVYFEDSFAGLTLHRSSLAEPNRAHDPSLFKLLTQFAEDKLAALEQRRSTAERVRLNLRALEDVSDASAEGMASAFGMSLRTFHRRLRAEGTSYRRVVADFRLQRCDLALSQSSSAKNIAYALGFASPGSFHRAFKRWTGRTIGEYRRHRDRPLQSFGMSKDEVTP
jgi:AraC-like DNA-binding protein